MAGRARTKALAELMETRALAYFELSPSIDTIPETLVLDYVAEWVESGQTLKDLSIALSGTLGHDVSYARLMAVLREQHGESAVEERLEASRVRASHPMAEEALSLVDAPADSNVDVSRAASRARTRQWLAEKWNRKAYGQDKGVSVSVSIGSLHLDALRAVGQLGREVTGSHTVGGIGNSVTQQLLPQPSE